MNFVALALLEACGGNDENAFWILAGMCENLELEVCFLRLLRLYCYKKSKEACKLGVVFEGAGCKVFVEPQVAAVVLRKEHAMLLAACQKDGKYAYPTRNAVCRLDRNDTGIMYWPFDTQYAPPPPNTSMLFTVQGLWCHGLERLDLCFFSLERLLRRHCPSLRQHLSDEGVELSMFTSRWFVTLFTSTEVFGRGTSRKVWDLYSLKPDVFVSRLFMPHGLVRDIEKTVVWAFGGSAFGDCVCVLRVRCSWFTSCCVFIDFHYLRCRHYSVSQLPMMLDSRYRCTQSPKGSCAVPHNSK